jgi:O2-independent ubiquinone biosynthesis protein UbiV
MTTALPLRLALAPLPYYWPRQAVFDLYADVAAAPVDIVYLGETVCPRRHELRWADWLEIAAMLAAAGKEVVLSTLPLIEAEADLRLLRRIVGETQFRIEANDFGAVSLLEQRADGGPWVAGATLNVFSPQALSLLHAAGARRWVAPAEMPAKALGELLAAAPADIETELLVHGRLPLAYSARCFTARHYNLQKDQCEYRCLAHPDGLALRTREGQPFLNLNGIQTESAGTYSLLAELPALAAAGVAIARVSPTGRPEGEHRSAQLDTVALIGIFRAVIDGKLDAPEAHARLAALLPAVPCNGFWYGRPGADWVRPAA